MKNKAIKLIAILLLSNFFLVNFVFAQTATPPATQPSSRGNVVLTKDKEALAQRNADECKKFRADVSYVFNGNYKAVWQVLPFKDGSVPVASNGCFIVPGDYKDDNVIYAEISNIPPGAAEIQATIREGNGVSSLAIADAQIKDLKALSEANWFSKLVGGVINSIFTAVTAFVSVLTVIAGKVYDVAVRESIGVTSMPPIVNAGWMIVRDIANMFFILVLIVIALAAILRIESYDYRHLLAEVVMMAILVNFSKVIAETLINFANLLASLFATNGIRDIFGFVINTIRPDEIYKVWSDGGWLAGLVQGLTKLIFSLIALSAFLALAGLFVVRLVGLYVLVILSPMAYVLDILPATKHYAHEWWQTFVKYLIWAPVALFFVNITFLLAKNMGGITNSTESSFKFIILMAFMWGSVIIAEHAGMVGGNAVIQGAEKIGHGIGHMVSGYAGRKYNEITTSRLLESHDGKERGVLSRAAFAVLNPVAAYKGSQQRSHELSHMAEEEAMAGGREVIEQAFTTGLNPFKKGFGKAKLKIPYRQFVARKDEDKFLKDYGNMKKESVMRAAVDAEGMTGFEGEARKRAIVKAAAANGYLDDVMRMKQFASKYGEKDGTIYSAETLNRFLYDYLGHGEQSMRFMAEDMEELGKKTKHFEYLGHAYYNNDEQKWERGMEELPGEDEGINGNKITKLKNTWQKDYAASEFGKLGGRDRVGAAPHNFTTIRAEFDADGNMIMNKKPKKDAEGNELIGPDGEPIMENILTGDEISHADFGRLNGKFDSFNKSMLQKMDADTMREVQHMQERMKGWLLSRKVVEGTGEVQLQDETHFNEIKELWNISPDIVLGLYTKVLSVKGDEREKLGGIKIIYKDQTGQVRHESIGKPKLTGWQSKPPKVFYSDGTASGEKEKSSGGKPTPEERSAASGARTINP